MRLVNRSDAFFLDLDGVVYVGDEALPSAAETIAWFEILSEQLRRGW